MRHFVLGAAVASYVLAACGHGDATGGAGSGAPPTTPVVGTGSTGAGSAAAGSAATGTAGSAATGSATGATATDGSQAAAEPPKPAEPPQLTVPPPPGGHDFTQSAKLLLIVGACGEGAAPAEIPEALLKRHCDPVHQVQDAYKENWVKKARAFFAEKVPKTVPKKVVYPFAGGDLSTALTVFPEAEEITTLSLEPAGDPRTLEALLGLPSGLSSGLSNGLPNAGGKAAPAGAAEPAKDPVTLPPGQAPAKPKQPRVNPLLEKALATIQSELRFLYRVNFSNTANMITAMRVGELPTQLVFGLSAMKVHGYEIVSLRYFKLDANGVIQYLADEDVAKAPDPLKGRAAARNALFSNAELRFRKPGGPVQTYRHIQYNLDDANLKKDPRVIKHLDAKGTIASMTKAASYLLSWDTFATVRNYLLSHTVWMVSDATGVAPRWGKAAGFEYETYGVFTLAHLKEGHGISADWAKEWKSQPQRALPFRFGYYDNKINNHLVIMRKKAT